MDKIKLMSELPSDLSPEALKKLLELNGWMPRTIDRQGCPIYSSGIEFFHHKYATELFFESDTSHPEYLESVAEILLELSGLYSVSVLKVLKRLMDIHWRFECHLMLGLNLDYYNLELL